MNRVDRMNWEPSDEMRQAARADGLRRQIARIKQTNAKARKTRQLKLQKELELARKKIADLDAKEKHRKAELNRLNKMIAVMERQGPGRGQVPMMPMSQVNNSRRIPAAPPPPPPPPPRANSRRIVASSRANTRANTRAAAPPPPPPPPRRQAPKSNLAIWMNKAPKESNIMEGYRKMMKRNGATNSNNAPSKGIRALMIRKGNVPIE